MSSSYEVISVFLDDEPFDSDELVRALSDPAGRAFLIDLVALRGIVQPAETCRHSEAPTPRDPRCGGPRPPPRPCSLPSPVGISSATDVASTPVSDAPPPTRIVQAVPFVPTGGM